MNKISKEDIKEFKGFNNFNSIIVFCLLFTISFLVWYVVGYTINVEQDGIILTFFITLLTGLGAIGFWLSLLPNIYRAQQWIDKGEDKTRRRRRR